MFNFYFIAILLAFSKAFPVPQAPETSPTRNLEAPDVRPPDVAAPEFYE